MTLEADAVQWLRAAVGEWLAETAPDFAAQIDRHGGRSQHVGRPGNGLSGEEWAAVAVAAQQHNLEPLLYELVERGQLTVPAAIRETWEKQYFGNQVFNLSLLETTAELLDTARGAGIELVVLKGPASIARYYQDPGLRVMVDLDLLCRQADLEALVRVATASGFETVGENATYHLTLRHPELGAGLELHFDLYEVIGRRSELIEEVFATCERLEVAGCSFDAPSAAADAVLQLAHILHHDQRVDLRHWLDFALAVRARREDAELARWLRLADLEPEYEENQNVVARLFTDETGPGSGQLSPAVWASVEAGLLDREDRRALLSGARMHSGWLDRAGYIARLLVPSPRRWRALAEAEGTAVSIALARHLRRALERGKNKVARRDRAQAPAESPRARLFRRRKRAGSSMRGSSR